MNISIFVGSYWEGSTKTGVEHDEFMPSSLAVSPSAPAVGVSTWLVRVRGKYGSWAEVLDCSSLPECATALLRCGSTWLVASSQKTLAILKTVEIRESSHFVRPLLQRCAAAL